MERLVLKDKAVPLEIPEQLEHPEL